MNVRRVDFAKPFFSQSDLDEVLSEMRKILKSGWLTSSKMVERFEAIFAEFIGTSSAVATNSCTAALHAILLSAGVKPGDEVIVPSNTFIATANSALYVGARPVLADSDLDTFNISPEDVRRKITPRTKAIILVHLAGNPCDMKELQEIAQAKNLALIEDCAHAHGARSAIGRCGTLGIAGAFSFYPTKIITTGEGGMVTTDDMELAQKVKRIRNHGRGSYGPAENTELGFNYRMSDLLAAIGLNQMKHVEEFLALRRSVADRYRSFLERFEWISPQLIRHGNQSSYYAFLIRLARNAPIGRDVLMKRLEERGVGTSVMYYPVHDQPFYVGMYGGDSTCPVASELGKCALALPLYNGMSEEEVAFVEEQFENAVEASASPVTGMS